MKSRNGSNNNPTPYQFNNTFKRLILYHDIYQGGGNCLSLDTTLILTLQSISKPKQREVSIDELGSIKKYGFNHEEVIDDHNYGQEFASFFDIITENVLVT
ncbi:uncharacterized protein [Leptinotarsa decemlineata]|uniref:uncharacterized protein n=1 Tax=Leptinotarsa decemlineata TaxID=7539 RepID=UPI003D30BDBC